MASYCASPSASPSNDTIARPVLPPPLEYKSSASHDLSFEPLPSNISSSTLLDHFLLSSYSFSFHSIFKRTTTAPPTMSAPNETPFNWNGLSTELKTKILEHNVADWPTYFLVSRQVRIITVHLTFRHVIHFVWTDPSDLRRDAIRCSKQRQMALPVTARDISAFNLYSRFPNQHPHLSRFATFKHAIRRATLAFDFRTYIHFFKINTSGWQTGPERSLVNVDHLTTQLPSLTHLTVVLPAYKDVVFDRSRDIYRIFDPLDPCYRALHRTIYTAVAHELVSIPHITVKGFIDAHEEENYTALRQTALARAVKLTLDDLALLYANDAGGIPLSPAEAFVDLRRLPGVCRNWTPPRCVCDVPCAPIFAGKPAHECDEYVRLHPDMAARDQVRADEARMRREEEEKQAALEALIAAQAATVGFDEVL